MTSPPAAPSPTDRRRASRLQLALPLACLLGSPGGDESIAEVLNLSEVGVLLACTRVVRPGQEVSLTLYNRSLGRNCPAQARVVRRIDAAPWLFHVGCAFLQPLNLAELVALLA